MAEERERGPKLTKGKADAKFGADLEDLRVRFVANGRESGGLSELSRLVGYGLQREGRGLASNVKRLKGGEVREEGGEL